MPKLIENAKENILRRAKDELLTHGYDALAIRDVARSCGIAVGTVYNYFPSKDMLAASVMLEDWRAAMDAAHRACEDAPGVPEALRALYGSVADFSAIYRSVWAGYTCSDSAKTSYARYHNKLVQQIADCILPVLNRTGAVDADTLSVFLAENVLVCTNGSAMTFDTLLRIAARLLP